MKNIKNEGITLIALVVSIIVLLILAGISISMLAGDNGILNQAADAKVKTEEASEKEQIKTAILSSLISTNHKLEHLSLQKAFDVDLGEGYITVIGPYEDYILIKVNDKNKYYLIDKNGNIQEVLDEDIDISIVGIYEETPTTLSGDGTESNPFKIYCIEDLIIYANEPKKFSGYITIENDLNFKSAASYSNYRTTEFGDINENGKEEDLLTELTTEKGFKPISLDNRSAKKELILDGKDHKIENLYIERSGNVGLYGLLWDTHNQTIIKNIKIAGDITSTNNVGGSLIGTLEGTNLYISDVQSEVNVTAKLSAAGFIGRCQGGNISPFINICFCCNNGTIISDNYAYGLVGTRRADSYSQDLLIKNSYNTGILDGKSIGGLVYGIGYYYSPKLNIINSYCNCEMKNATNIGGICEYGGACKNGKSSIGLKNVCNFSEIKSQNKKYRGIVYSLENETIYEAKYVYYPNNYETATPDDTTYTGTTATDLNEMFSQTFIDTLNTNIKELEQEGLAKWIIGIDGKPTLDFNTVWDIEKEEWVCR